MDSSFTSRKLRLCMNELSKKYVWQGSAGNDHQRNNFCMLDIEPSGIKLGQFSRESVTHLTTQMCVGGHKELSWVSLFGGQAGGLEKQAIVIPQNYSSKEGDRTMDFSKQPGTAAGNILQNPQRKQKQISKEETENSSCETELYTLKLFNDSSVMMSSHKGIK